MIPQLVNISERRERKSIVKTRREVFFGGGVNKKVVGGASCNYFMASIEGRGTFNVSAESKLLSFKDTSTVFVSYLDMNFG